MLQIKAKEITERAAQYNRFEQEQKNAIYAKKLTTKYVKPRAEKAYNNVEIKISRRYNKNAICRCLQTLGYEVKNGSKQNRLLIKW